jgi:hypothetical protein
MTTYLGDRVVCAGCDSTAHADLTEIDGRRFCPECWPALVCPGAVLASDRRCLSCHWPVLEGRGVGYPHLRALVHQGACAATVNGLERVHE